MDLLHPSGHHTDAAACDKCTWEAGGIYAEHSGYHHWLETRHTWHLTPFMTGAAK
jgi:hypothetical protein